VGANGVEVPQRDDVEVVVLAGAAQVAKNAFNLKKVGV
jgi:hypothetical protein